MSNFDFAAAIKQRPGGATQAELIAAYGNPLLDSTPHPTQRGWFTPGPMWTRQNLVEIPTAELPGFPPFGDQQVRTIRLHRLVAPVFRATWAELVARNLHTRLRTYSGAFAPRHMLHDPRRPVSVHAYGAAIDVEAAWNGYGIPHERMGIDREVVEVFERCGWEWGGRWDVSDGMHFQWTDPLPGVRQAAWRDAGPVPITPPAPPPPPTPAGPVYIWAAVRNGDGSVRPGEVVSIPVSADGRLLVQADGRPKIYRVPESRLAEREV
ncbi:M15 family metallopeptidase [Deinococcus sp. MIMF12]|uniref:M15 family metallopeptidase n=1 Tax=Deinococcus rhizophilus TaxID=3049544 RepID=A0ABT7JDI9_9DEIO|nr:M15 family metallopeptidase [Deinococcus rhizophilus]MDL2342545.1 M15 family metallopeptidase [Deinococcus rhizophilus]